MEHNLRNAMAYSLQSWNWLEDKRNKDNKISWEVWKVVETKAEKVRVAKEKGRRKIKKEQEVRRKRKDKETVKSEKEAKKLVSPRFHK